MISRFTSSLNLRPDEYRPTTLLFVFSFFTGAATIFSYTAAFSLFLSVFEEKSFAYVFIVAALLSLVLGALFTRLEQKVSTNRLFQSTTVILLVSSILLQVGLWLEAGAWLFWILLLWYRLYFILINLAFWGIAGRVFNVQQGKRLFGFVGTGEDIAKIIGYGFVPLIIPLVGLNNILALNAITIVGCLVAIGLLSPYIVDSKPTDAAGRLEEEQARYGLWETVQLFIELFNQRYIRAIFSISFLAVVSYFIIDYGFYRVVRQQFPTPTQLAQFIGYFWMGVYIFSFAVRLFFTNPLLRRWGLFAGLIFLPVIFGALSLTLITSSFIAPASIFLFLVVSAIKFIEDSLVGTTHRTSTTLLYQPLPAKTGLASQVVAETLIAPMGLGFAGLLILLFNNLPFFNWTWFSAVLLVLAGLRLWTMREVFKGYVINLNRALSQRRLQGSLSDLDDSASQAVLLDYLDSKDPSSVVYALDLLEKVAPNKLVPHLERLLSHPNDWVARAAVQGIGRLGLTDTLPQVRQLAARQNPVSPEAVYTIMALEKESAGDYALPFLESDSLTLVKQTILGLMHFGGYSHKAIAAKKIKALSSSEQVEERVAMAEIFGRLNANDLQEVLEALIQDKSPSVKKRAIQSLIDQNGVYGLRENLKKYENDPALFDQLVLSLRFAEGHGVIEDLLDYFNHSDPSIRLSVYKSLDAHGYIALNQEARSDIEKGIESELRLASWASVGLADLSKDGEGGLLQRALVEMIDDVRSRLFLLLSFIYDKAILDRVESDLKKGDSSRQIALVIEALSNHLSSQHWQMVAPIIQESDSKELWMRLKGRSDEPRLSYINRVETIIMTPEVGGLITPEWLRITALYDLGVKKLTELKDVVAFCAVHDNLLIRETAEWALDQIEAA